MRFENAGPHAEPDLLAVAVGMTENYRRDRLAEAGRRLKHRTLVAGRHGAMQVI